MTYIPVKQRSYPATASNISPEGLERRADNFEREARQFLDDAQAEGRALTPEEKTEFDDLLETAATCRERAVDLRHTIEQRAQLDTLLGGASRGVSDSWSSPQLMRRVEAWSDDPQALNDHDALSQARAALDATQRRSAVPDSGLAKVADVINTGAGAEPGRIARWAIATSNPAYERAFTKLLRDPDRGHLVWTEEERAAYSTVVELKRAMSLTDANGGYMVPFTLDPAIMLTNDGSNNPLRRLATVKLTTTDTWNGVTSAGASAEWKSEAAEVADGSPTLGQPSIPTFFGDSFVPYSFEWGMDTPDALRELSLVLADAADNLMATAYTTGNGTTAPQGIVTGLAGTASEINTTGTEALDDSDPYALQNALPARFSANATFQSHIATANAYRQMETTNGAHAFPELRENPPRLLGKPWFENSNMDSTINPAATGNNYMMIYGDVGRGFFIVDRIGATLELIPNLMGANNRPTGQRGALLWFRTGSKVVVPQALRMLDVPTAA